MSKNKITPNSILHFNKKATEDEDVIMADEITLDNILEKSSSDNVSDAMKNLYGEYGLVRDVKPLNGTDRVSGFIRTVDTNSNDWGTCIKGIYACRPGEILFIKCSDDEYAVWGELASSAAYAHGVKATVIVGASRDTSEIIELGFPLFSRTTMSRAGLPLNRGVIGEDLFINDLVIRTGDFAVCDSDGVVVIPRDKIDEVLEEVNNIKKFEQKIIKELFEDNKRLDDIVGF
ncbi:MAG: RraA family protein [Methanosphaera sp.]|nr:RraA family protein [Methanosphaera sp.]